jgi:general secretion pathway protein E
MLWRGGGVMAIAEGRDGGAMLSGCVLGGSSSNSPAALVAGGDVGEDGGAITMGAWASSLLEWVATTASTTTTPPHNTLKMSGVHSASDFQYTRKNIRSRPKGVSSPQICPYNCCDRQAPPNPYNLSFRPCWYSRPGTGRHCSFSLDTGCFWLIGRPKLLGQACKSARRVFYPLAYLPMTLKPTPVALQAGWSAASEALDIRSTEAARAWGLDYVELSEFTPEVELLSRFPAPALFRHAVLPLTRSGDRVRIALSDPRNFGVLEELTAFSGVLLEPVLADRIQIERHLRAHFGVGGGTVQDLLANDDNDHDLQPTTNEVADAEETASVIKLVNELLSDAVRQEASDIHLEPDAMRMVVRFRVDGVLHPQATPAELHRFRSAMISRLKIMARLNIAEKRIAQDGGFRIHVQQRELDVRVSVIPMQHGEGVVMRLLDKSRMQLTLPGLSVPAPIQVAWSKLIHQPHGMLLVTGPTGSGKTTTLYASIQQINSDDKKIITIEDPIEYTLRGTNQIQVHTKVGLTFASGLRSVLRHDPDVILIGEVRDQDTASACIQASLTGHLVLSTLHTNDAVGAYTRLVDMGVERFLVASTVHGVLAQRLVRRLCMHCKAVQPMDQLTIPNDFPGETGQTLYRAQGCRLCNHTGFRGRIGIFELLQSSSEIRRLVLTGASHDELRSAALAQGMTTLRQSGWQRVLAGETTIEEVLRVATSELD